MRSGNRKIVSLTKTCAVCGTEIPPNSRKTLYCSWECQRKRLQADRQRGYVENGYDKLPKGTIGAVHEMVVSVDLMRRGFHVFRAISPSCPCDLIAMREDGTSLRVEVKTGIRRADGTLVRIPRPEERNRYDVWAIVSHDGEIRYEPDIFTGDCHAKVV